MGLGSRRRRAALAVSSGQLFIKWYRIGNSLPKREGRRSLIPMPDRTLSMSTATIPALPAPYRAARRFSALELRIERGRRFATRTEGEEAPSNKNRPRIARNPLKKLISDERIQGNPNQSNPRKPHSCGATGSSCVGLRKSKYLAPEGTAPFKRAALRASSGTAEAYGVALNGFLTGYGGGGSPVVTAVRGPL